MCPQEYQTGQQRGQLVPSKKVHEGKGHKQRTTVQQVAELVLCDKQQAQNEMCGRKYTEHIIIINILVASSCNRLSDASLHNMIVWYNSLVYIVVLCLPTHTLTCSS